ncbi:uncharacterized protein [Diabrotica undecimpunctata]|uniref:uncharacterized protein n=1 Tax=Diabrotica undecimpunctata TaxID=50387 RepID=UPI003B6355B8
MFVNHDKISSLLNDTLLFWKIDTYPFKKERKVAQFMEKVLKFFLFWYPGVATANTLLVFLLPLIIHKRILPVSTFVPEYPPYWLLYLIECYGFTVIYIGVVYFDVLIGTLVMMVVIQWKLLNGKIHDVLERPVTNQKEKNLLQADIKTCIDYHNFLLNFVARINGTLYVTFLFYIVVTVLSACADTFIILRGNWGPNWKNWGHSAKDRRPLQKSSRSTRIGGCGDGPAPHRTEKKLYCKKS